MKFIRVLPILVAAIALGAVIICTPKANVAEDSQHMIDQTGPPKYIRIKLNDQPLRSSALARIIGDKSMVPLRPVAEAAGATVNRDKDGQTIYINHKDTNIKIVIGQSKAFLNDQPVNLDLSPQLTEGAVLVPLNLIREPLGLTVAWNTPERTLSILTPGYVPSSPSPKTSQAQSVPILMYHEIGDGPNNLYVRDSEFREQMRYLKEQNYRVVTMAEGLRMMQNYESMAKTVIVTFDDGYVSFFTKAWPVLREFNFPATIFVIAYYAGVPNYLDWEQMSMLRADWMEIGSHSNNHPALTKIGSTQLYEEIVGSKNLIEACLQVPCENFCYPGGHFNMNVAGVVKEAGYSSAVTTHYGQASLNYDMYELPRIRIPRGMTREAFARSL